MKRSLPGGWSRLRCDRIRALQFLAMTEALTPLRVSAGGAKGLSR
jgi:hypothetical protein